jgi:hypothetical protein
VTLMKKWYIISGFFISHSKKEMFMNHLIRMTGIALLMLSQAIPICAGERGGQENGFLKNVIPPEYQNRSKQEQMTYIIDSLVKLNVIASNEGDKAVSAFEKHLDKSRSKSKVSVPRMAPQGAPISSAMRLQIAKDLEQKRNNS